MANLRKPDVVTVLIHRADEGITVLRVVTTEYRPTTSEEKAKGLGDRIANWTIEPTEDYIKGIIEKYNWPPELQAVSWEIVPNEIAYKGQDRTFRSAWKKTQDGKNIEVDMPKAREIHRTRLRRMRKPILESLDVEYQKADEVDDVLLKKAIAKRKQDLRDVTLDAAIDAAQTPDELKKVIPDILKE